MPFYRAIVGDAEGDSADAIAAADNYLDAVEAAVAALERLGLEEAELQMSEDGENWTAVETHLRADNPDADL